MNNEIIENLFVLEFMRSEYSKHHNMKLSNIKFDEYLYDFVIQSANFKIIRSLLIIDNEYCEQELFHKNDKVYYKGINYIKEVKNEQTE